MPAKSSKDIAIDNLRGVMLLGIFAYHSLSALVYVRTPQWLPLNIQMTLTQCLSRILGTFFLLSGYFSVKVYTTWDFHQWFNLVKRRFQSLMIPYLLWNAIYISVFWFGSWFLPIIAERVQELSLNSVGGVLGAWLGIWTRPADGPLWYVRDTFYLIILLPLLVLLAKWSGKWLPLYLPAMFLIPPLCWRIFGTCPIAPYALIAFTLGIYMRIYGISLHCFENSPVWAAIGLVLCLFYSFGFISLTPLAWLFEAGLEYLVLIPTCLWLMKWLTYDQDTLAYRILTKPSFFIFAAHALCASTVVRLLGPFIPDFPVKGILMASFYVLGGSALLYPIYYLMGRFMPRFRNILIGGRG